MGRELRCSPADKTQLCTHGNGDLCMESYLHIHIRIHPITYVCTYVPTYIHE